jgi:hypothetical protein
MMGIHDCTTDRNVFQVFKLCRIAEINDNRKTYYYCLLYKVHNTLLYYIYVYHGSCEQGYDAEYKYFLSNFPHLMLS